MSNFTDVLKNIFWALLILQFAAPVFKNVKKQWSDHTEPKNKVGMITMQSTISSSGRWNKQLRKFFKDPEIKAILMKIDSPGGAAGSSQAICQEIVQLKKLYPKPIITYSENICASGAYVIAANTDYVITTGSALVGSIGSKLCTQFKVRKLLEDWKIQALDVSSGSFKNCCDPFTDITDEQRAMLKQLTDDCYEQIVSDVAHCRHLSVAQKDVWANGKIFTGHEALGLKLVDEIGNQTTALDHIKKQILHSDREIELIKVAQSSAWQKFMHSDEDDDDNELENSMSSALWGGLFQFLQNQGISV